MADINGTAGNDTLSLSGNNSLVFNLSGTIAEGIRPIVNVLVNGSVVASNVTITADANLGQIQTLSFTIPGAVTRIDLQYANDVQTDFTQDRNLLVSSVVLNGQALPGSSLSYTRLADGQIYDTIDVNQWFSLTGGVPLMKWGGTLDFAGPALAAAAAPSLSGNLSIDGGAGTDTLLVDSVRSNFSITQSATGFTLDRLSGGETLQLTNVERVHFTDGVSHALDMNGNAGAAVQIISALFGPSFVNNASIVGIGISLLDAGMSPLQLVGLAESTGAFQQLAGSTSNADVVRLLFQNVVGVQPNADQLNTFVGLLDSGTFTQASLGLAAAHLVGVPPTGVDFV